jgi:hypothetical protein
MPILWVCGLFYFNRLYNDIFVANKLLCMVVLIASGGFNIQTIYHAFQQVLEDGGSPVFDICLSYGYLISRILIVCTQPFLLPSQLRNPCAWLR